MYRALTRPQTTQEPVRGIDLRARRTAQGISQTQAAKALDTWPARISDIETDRRPLKTLRANYQQGLQTA
ncbi:helix-turn-helix domain-containing protein [Scrofimicrobium canadense]|uniref:helix-turn-helix domain-containing protein n=1 Tax=Scrofimicrobium canadense TaxID=2652290 RepID=UPI00298E58D9|nr:helix-turn-helix transcriptional regulator [Scrofimicrobium canadense]